MSDTMAIECRNLSKRFTIGTRDRLTLFQTFRHKLSGEYPKRELWALRDITFSMKKGEMVAVIGPNGAGKTTLLRILSGIMAPTAGSCETRGDVSCIFELGLGFNPRFTAIENVYHYGALHGMTRRQIDRKLPDIIDFSELGGFLGAKISEFSSGMRARLAFATVIQTVRGIVMIDEVLAVGDQGFRQKCIRAIERMQNEGNTILFIAHGIDYVRHLCSRALYIEGGVQRGFGNVDEIEQMYEERHVTRDAPGADSQDR